MTAELPIVDTRVDMNVSRFFGSDEDWSGGCLRVAHGASLGGCGCSPRNTDHSAESWRATSKSAWRGVTGRLWAYEARMGNRITAMLHHIRHVEQLQAPQKQQQVAHAGSELMLAAPIGDRHFVWHSRVLRSSCCGTPLAHQNSPDILSRDPRQGQS